MTPSVLFVCLGNICRSPLAEGALRKSCADAGQSMIIDSAGTGNWHVDQPPDQRAIAVAAEHGVDIAHLRGRQVRAADFRDFDHVIALDTQNLADLEAIRPADGKARLSLLMDHVEGARGRDVADPYYGDETDFEQSWQEITRAAQAVLQSLGR